MSEAESLWHGELDEDLKRSIRQNYARAAFGQFMDSQIDSKVLFGTLQKLLCVPDPKVRLPFGKHSFNSSDRELIGELVQLSTLSKTKNNKRGRGNKPSSLVLKLQARSIATFLLNERPDALRKEVEHRVYQLMAIDGGEFIQSRRTIEIWLKPFFSARRKVPLSRNLS